MFKIFAVILGTMLVAVNCGLLPGGYSDHPELLHDSRVQALATYAAEYLAIKENIYLSHIKLTRVQTQVVAGMNYKLDFTAESISGGSGKLTTCQAIIYVRFDQTQKVTKVECH
ncbi:unnamed protein product [Rotaria sp. Silwood1]|nr:unnamed protein product [Rotaria sp. Silwood1]CAF1577455.1 unnamed protein product [Rotaria sp. Silwood1]CAF3721105.1 unnamed protein product [Rotaria sp. Silwood1]CAF3770725.1 unnamed protein product [Rotaria sp. Silwood1]CAF4829248.1 unnamed protein product [Rotaria sp. Silwood1]